MCGLVTVIRLMEVTWQGEVSPRGLVGDPVVHDGQMLLEGLAQAAVGLRDKLLLTFGAGDQVDEMARLTVHTTVDLDGLARHGGLDSSQRIDVLTHSAVRLLALHKAGRPVAWGHSHLTVDILMV